MHSAAASATTPERAWWRRVVQVPLRPAPAFLALEDTSAEDEQARQEPLLALIILAGVGVTLMTSFAGRVLDEQSLGTLELAIWAFVGGAFNGFLLYWIIGALVFVGASAAGSELSYRQARHILAFAAIPLALALLLWPPRLALFGSDSFRTGGGTGEGLFELADLALLAWFAGLLAYGLKVAHAWPWTRAVAAAALPLLVPALALLRAYGVL